MGYLSARNLLAYSILFEEDVCIPLNSTLWGGVAGKLPGGNAPGVVGWQMAESEPAVCPGGQEGQRHPGLYQEYCGQQE